MFHQFPGFNMVTVTWSIVPTNYLKIVQPNMGMTIFTTMIVNIIFYPVCDDL